MTMICRARNHRAAFTMIELMLVISIMIIIGLLAALAISEVVVHANVKETESTMHLMTVALDEFKADMGEYPLSTGTETWETVVHALTDPKSSYGWKRASLSGWFENRDEVTDETGHLRVPDAWDEDFVYCSSTPKIVSGTAESEYFYSGRGVERTPGKRDYYNLKTYQLYSKGPNMKTWASTADGGHDQLGGTEPDDIRNWTQEVFHTTVPY